MTLGSNEEGEDLMHRTLLSIYFRETEGMLTWLNNSSEPEHDEMENLP